MPVELWWWVEPLFETGLLALVVFGVIAVLLDKAIPNHPASYFFTMLAVAPWLITSFCVVLWLLTNALVLIWR